MNNELLTAQDLAKSLNLSVETIWKYTREKRIPYIELGNKQYRYQLDNVLEALATSIVKEKTAEYRSADKPLENLTYQDYLYLPEEPGYHYEIIDGLLIKEPSPNVSHQRVSRKLQRILEDYFLESDPQGEIFNAPLDVTFHDTTVVQPDLFYVSGDKKIIVKDARIDGSPTLIVEIISPSSSRKDRFKKLQVYKKAQVLHYWLVNPEEKTIECFSLQNNNYALLTVGIDNETIEHPSFPGLSFPLNALWQ